MNHLTERTKRYLLSHSTEIHSIKEVSRALDVSYEYLRKVFVRDMDISLGQYLHVVRVEQAKTFLGKYEKKLYAIAREVGYANEQMLIRNFKKVTDMTPTEYRMKLKGDYQSIRSERSLDVPHPLQRNPKMTTKSDN